MSNLVKCKTCEKDVSRNAQTCIHCGEPLFSEEIIQRNQNLQENFSNNIGIMGVIASVSTVVLMAYVYFVGGFISEGLGLGNWWGLMISCLTGAPFSLWVYAYLINEFKP